MIKRIAIVVLAFMMLLGNGKPYAADTEGKTVKVGVYDMDGFFDYNAEGKVEGFCIDYLNVIAEITRWEYEFVKIADFKEGIERIRNGELDLIAPATVTDTRKEEFAFSDLHFGMEHTILFTMPDREDLFYQDYENYDGLKIGVINDYPMTDFFIEKMTLHGINAELVYFENLQECEAELQNGSIDAMVASILRYKEEYKLLDSFSPQPIYFLTHKDNTSLLSELNKAMEQIQETYPTMLDELLYMYYPIYEQHFLTREEIEYIEQEKVLRVAYVADRRPLSFTDEKAEFAGITRVLCDRIAEISGLKFEYIELPAGAITYEYLQMMEIDLLTGVEYNNANMQSRGVYLSRPYITGRKVLVGGKNSVFSAENQYKVAIVAGSKTFKNVVMDKYPNMDVIEYETVDACFTALQEGQVDMLLQNQYVVESLMMKPMYSDFTVVPIEGVEDQLCFSTISPLDGGYGLDEKESTIVISILNKAICQIQDVEMDSIVMKQVVENQYKLEIGDFLYTYRYTILMMVTAAMPALFLAIVYNREKKRVKKIEEEEARLKELQQKRYQTILDCSDDMIYEISVDGKSKMGSEKIKEKFGWEIPLSGQTLDPERVMEILHVYPEDEAIFRQTQLDTGEAEFDNLTLRICKVDGTPIWCNMSRTVLKDKYNHPISILGKIVDIDEDVKEKQMLEKRSRTDILTGLLNKQTFEAEVREYVEKYDSKDCSFIFIDMDHFKEINDTFGHSVGDFVIKETAQKIQLLFANFDSVGRFGGDEFCVFVKGIPRETLVDRLQFAVAKLEKAYTYDGITVTISASIGAVYCKKENVGYKTLMDAADDAAYQAKDNGRNTYVMKDI